MYEKILVADQNIVVLNEIVEAVRQDFPGATIDLATSLSEASELADLTFSRGGHYDVACVDLYLRKTNNDALAKEIYLPERIALFDALGFQTLAVNYLLSHEKNENLQKVLLEINDKTSLKSIYIPLNGELSKNNPLRFSIRQSIYSRRITGAIDGMLASRNGYHLTIPYHGSGTHALGALMRDIHESWNDLDEYLRERIRTVFDVQEINGELLVKR